jgi:hypothetical protein
MQAAMLLQSAEKASAGTRERSFFAYRCILRV